MRALYKDKLCLDQVKICIKIQEMNYWSVKEKSKMKEI